MGHEATEEKVTRRSFSEAGSGAPGVAGVASLASLPARGQERTQLSSQDRSTSDPGPANKEMDAQNPDAAWPPTTDSESLVPVFKYPFSLANKRTYKGGWSREVTVRELPVSKSLAAVNMRLTAGGVR